MKKLILSIAALVFITSSAFAERYIMVTHGEGKDPFWPVVQKGGEDAARAIGADFEYIYNHLLIWLIWQAQFKPLQLLNQMVW